MARGCRVDGRHAGATPPPPVAAAAAAALVRSRPGRAADVTTRTVRRDVERLRALGYPVDAAPGTTRGYRLAIGTSLPPLLLDDEEATAIAIALGLTAGGAVRGVEEPALAALAKLDRVAPRSPPRRVEAVRTATIPLGGDAVRAEVRVTVARAASERERLQVTYVDREGRETDRRIDPFRVVSTGRGGTSSPSTSTGERGGRSGSIASERSDRPGTGSASTTRPTRPSW